MAERTGKIYFYIKGETEPSYTLNVTQTSLNTGSGGNDPSTGGKNYNITVNPSQMLISAEGRNVGIELTYDAANTGILCETLNASSWLHPTLDYVRVDSNKERDGRTGMAIWRSDKDKTQFASMEVEQAGCYVDAIIQGQTLRSDGENSTEFENVYGILIVSVDASGNGYDVMIPGDTTWIKTSIDGQNTLYIDVEKNDTGYYREGSVHILSKDVKGVAVCIDFKQHS